MQQQADCRSMSCYQFPQNSDNPNPNPNPSPIYHHQAPPPPPPTYASAPPFTTNQNYPSTDYPPYSAAIPACSPYAPSSDLLPTAPSYSPNSNLHSFNPPPPSSQPPSFPQFESHAPYQSQTQTQTQHQSYYLPFDQHQSTPNYARPDPSPSPSPAHSTPYSAATYSNISSAVLPAYENSYERNVKFDQVGGYPDHYSGSYGQARADFGLDLYGKRADGGGSARYDSGGHRYDGYGVDVYAYRGSKVEPYGARGTAPKSSTWSGFDDFGRPIGFSSGKDQSSGSPKIVRAVAKADNQQDVTSGVQKFRVKLLPDGGNSSTMDVLCQVGLDGIRMLDPSSSRLLRIYPLDSVTKCEATDSSTFTFWSKSSVDIEPRRIRLQSNSYTTNTILDTVTAATVQFKEMGRTSRPSDISKTPEQPTEKKKGFADWMNLIKPVNEEKDYWVPDEVVTKCTACGTDFSAFVRKHHCRNCGDIFCDKCTHGKIALTADKNALQVRVCDRCMAEVTQRLNNVRESACKSSGLQSHEDLAKKLQDEMERNRKGLLGSRSDASGRRMKEVACPTCTVHLQVQVPISGSETIECGVCQHPFLVSAH